MMRKGFISLLCALLCMGVGGVGMAAQDGAIKSEHKVLIRDVELLDKPFGDRYSIAICGTKIVSIGKEEPAGFAPDEVIDAKGKLATPGLVNTHGHVSMTLLRSYADDMALADWLNNKIWPIEAKMTAEDMYWGAMLGITEMLKSGTTCFADMYFNMDHVAKACAKLGIRANICGALMSVRPTAQDDLKADIALYDKWHGYDEGRIRVTLGPHAPYTCDDAYLKQVAVTAKEHGIEVQMHLCETKDEVKTSQQQYGLTPIERMEKLGLLDCGVIASHCVHLTEADRQIMARHKVRVAHNPQSNLKLASGVADLPAMLRQGLVVGLGTDGASSNNNLDILEEVRLAATLHKGVTYDPLSIPASTAFALGTHMGAKVLGFDNVGKLEAGYAADIVLWDMEKPYWYPRTNKLSLLVYAACSSDADTVLVNGRKVVEGGKLLTYDEKEIYAQADKYAQALFHK